MTYVYVLYLKNRFFLPTLIDIGVISSRLKSNCKIIIKNQQSEISRKVLRVESHQAVVSHDSWGSEKIYCILM